MRQSSKGGVTRFHEAALVFHEAGELPSQKCRHRQSLLSRQDLRLAENVIVEREGDVASHGHSRKLRVTRNLRIDNRRCPGRLRFLPCPTATSTSWSRSIRRSPKGARCVFMRSARRGSCGRFSTNRWSGRKGISRS